VDSVEILIATTQEAEYTLGYVRLVLLGLALIGLGVLGILLLATLRRGAQRRRAREAGRVAPEPRADAWTESASRIKVQSRPLPPPPNADDGTA
jgi:hypothetical protein